MAAERGGAREGGEGGGFSRVENRVGLGVAAFTRGALEPDDVGAGVEDHAQFFFTTKAYFEIPTSCRSFS